MSAPDGDLQRARRPNETTPARTQLFNTRRRAAVGQAQRLDQEVLDSRVFPNTARQPTSDDVPTPRTGRRKGWGEVQPEPMQGKRGTVLVGDKVKGVTRGGRDEVTRGWKRLPG
jgi:hypothetical protein